MYVNARTSERVEEPVPDGQDTYWLENPCTEDGGHEYAVRICPNCGRDFCWTCCGGTNVHEGGKHEPDSMLCPSCGHDYFAQVE